MAVHNRDVAEILNEIADLLEIEDANPFRVRSYRNAARTGALGQLEELRRRTTPQLRELTRISSLGPKRVQKLHEELGVESLEELERAAREQKLRGVAGFGAKTESNILRDLERRKETVGDLDILATCEDSGPVMERFVSYEEVERVLSRGKTRSSVSLRSGIQVDLRVVGEESYGAAMHYFTGSKAHNVATRRIAVAKGLKINEYGVFRGTGGRDAGGKSSGGKEDSEQRRVAGRTEKEVYEQGGLPGGPAARAGAAGRHQGRPPAAHESHRRQDDDPGDGRRGPRARVRVHGCHRPLKARHHGPGAGGAPSRRADRGDR